MSLSDAEERVLSGKAWEEFCDGLKAAGKIIQNEKAPQDPLTQAEGYRYLSRMLRAGLESFMEYGDPLFPQLRTPCHETIKMGADNPDNFYQNTPLKPEFEYRIYGQRNTVDYLGFATVANRYASGGTMETTGFVDGADLDINDDGSFEIIISKNKADGNWIPMSEDTNSLNVRQTFQDRKTEVAAEIKIERLVSAEARPQSLSAEKLDSGLQGVLMFAQGASQMFTDWAISFADHVNEMPPADQDYCQSIGGDPNIYYYHSAWRLAGDEALVIEVDKIPSCHNWNFQLNNWWMESLDYRYHNIHVNKHTAVYNSDGSVRVIVSPQDTGLPNWIETAGHSQGTMCWRWIGAKEYPPIKCKVCKIADLKSKSTLGELG